MIAYAIEVAMKASLFDRVIVSTDCDTIAELALRYGAEVPFQRPSALSGDHVATQPVIKHAIETLNLKPRADVSEVAVCCIYPSVPFLNQDDLRSSYRRLQSSAQTGFVFSVTTFDYPVYRALQMEDPAGGPISLIYPQYEMKRSQDLPETWHDAGQYYWGRASAWCDDKPIFSAQSIGQPMPRYRAIDIDTPEDWRHAELLYRSMQLDRDVDV